MNRKLYRNLLALADETDEVAKILKQWVLRPTKAFRDPKTYQKVARFVHKNANLYLRPNYNFTVYRGFRVRPRQLVQLLKTGQLKLEDRKIESWSPIFYKAAEFAFGKDDGSAYGIVFSRKMIPKPSVIVDLSFFPESGYLYKGDWEIVTKQFCQVCLLKDVEMVSIRTRSFPKFKRLIQQAGYTIDGLKSDVHSIDFTIDQKQKRLNEIVVTKATMFARRDLSFLKKQPSSQFKQTETGMLLDEH